MAKSIPAVPPTFQQLPFPWLEPEREPTPPLPPPTAPTLLPEQVWTRLPLTMQRQVRQTILHILQEVLNDHPQP